MFTPPVLPNARLLRDVGTGLLDAQLADPLASQPQTPQMTFGDRLTGAATSIANTLDPNSSYGPEAFLGAATRGFAGVRNFLQAMAQQRTETQEANTTRDLERDRIRATTEAERARGESEKAQRDRANRPAEPRPEKSPPTPAADQWEEVRDIPVGQPRLQRNRRTGATKPVLDPRGRQMVVEAPPTTGRGGTPRAGVTPQTTPPSPTPPPLLNGKTARQWFDEVDHEHPNWSEAEVTAEAKRRAGVR